MFVLLQFLYQLISPWSILIGTYLCNCVLQGASLHEKCYKVRSFIKATLHEGNIKEPKLEQSSKKMHVPSWCASLELQSTISMRGPDNSFAAKYHPSWVSCFFLPISMCPSLLWVCTPLLLPEWNHHRPHTTCVSVLLLSQDTRCSCSNEKEQGSSWASGLFPAPPLTKDCLCPLSKSTARAI